MARNAGGKRQPRRNGAGVLKMGRNPNIPEPVTVAREARAWELYQQGRSQAAIAAQLQVEWPLYTMSQPAVCQALRRCEDRVLADLKDEQLREKSRQLARTEGIFLEAMAAWHLS